MVLSAKQLSRFSHAPQPSKLDGVRPDSYWIRPGKTHSRIDLTNRELVRAAQAVQFRKGSLWSPEDEGTMDELEVRTWGYGEVQRLTTWSLPSWVTEELLPARRQAGYHRFLGILLSAYRSGTCGVTLSYEEAMSLCWVGSRATWRKWCKEWEQLGLVRIIQCWREDTSDGPLRRCHARLSYRIGPAWEEFAGPALVEGAAVEGGKVTASWAQRVARGARKKARAVRRARKAALWKATRPGQSQGDSAPITNGVPVMAVEPAPEGETLLTEPHAEVKAARAEDVPQRGARAIVPPHAAHQGPATVARRLQSETSHGSPHPEPVKRRQVEDPVRSTATPPVNAPASEQATRVVLGPTGKRECKHGPPIVARPQDTGGSSFFNHRAQEQVARNAQSDPSLGSTPFELHSTPRPCGISRPSAGEGTALLAASRPPAETRPNIDMPGSTAHTAPSDPQALDGGGAGGAVRHCAPESFARWLREHCRVTRNTRFLAILGDAD